MRSPSPLRARQQLLTQRALFSQSVKHARMPLLPIEHADAKPLPVSGQHCSSTLQLPPTATVHELGGAHHRATLHARVPSPRVAQHPVAQSPFTEHRALQICPAPGSAAQTVATPLIAQHCSVVVHAAPAMSEQPPVHAHAP